MLHNLVLILLNYVVVQACIVTFMAPFYVVYRYRHRRAHGSETKLSLSRHLENFFLSKQANYLVFFWAMGEALIWFVIPEFLLLLMVFMRIRRKKELLTYDIGGTVAGTIVALMLHLPDRAIAGLPYIHEKMLVMTHGWYNHLGVWGLVYQPFSGVPYKVFTLMASQYHFFLPWFIVVAVAVRMSRYVIAFGLFVLIYPGLHKHVRRSYVPLFLIATFIFSALLLRVSHSLAH